MQGAQPVCPKCVKCPYHFVVLLRKLDGCILQRLERESRFPFSKKYFIFIKWFLNSSDGIWQGQLTGEGGKRRQFTGEKSACTMIPNTKLSLKKCYWIPRGVYLWLLLLLYSTIIQLLTTVFTSLNKSTNQSIS